MLREPAPAPLTASTFLTAGIGIVASVVVHHGREEGVAVQTRACDEVPGTLERLAGAPHLREQRAQASMCDCLAC